MNVFIREQGPSAEVVPEDVGMDSRRLQRVHEMILRRGAIAQLCVARHGQLVKHTNYGCDPDNLFWLFSTSKPYLAILTHRLAERGTFALDDPVADYWPEFGCSGKDAITIDHVLQHRTGFATSATVLHDVLACTDWDRMIRLIERVRPRWPAGSGPGYQFLIFGFILGEVIQRATGRSLREVLEAELLDPLGLHDTLLGVGPEQQPRSIPLVFRHPGGTIATGRLNLPVTRAAIVPSAGISATAVDVIGFYQMLLAGGRSDDQSVISPESIAHATEPSTDGEIDRLCRIPIPWSHGFQLGGRRGPGRVPPFGYRSTRRTFGHNGSNCVLAWADPDRDLAIAYLTNFRSRNADDMSHLAAISDQLFVACQD